MKKYYIFIVMVWLVALLLTLLTVENPITKGRQISDQDTLISMTSLSGTIETYYRMQKRLPENLEEISKQGIYLDLEERGYKIDYKIKGIYQYQLCAEFQTDTTNIGSETPYDDSKKHKEGYDCIDFEVSEYSRNYNSGKPVIVSSKPTPLPTPYDSQSVKFYVQSEYEASGTNTYLQANLSKNMRIEYAKDEDNGGKTIIHLDNEPLLEFTIVTKNNPTHFLTYKKLDGSKPGGERYLVGIASSKPDEVEYLYTNAVSIGSNCSNQGVVEWPCGPLSIYSLSVRFTGDLKDIEIANNVVSSLEFL